MLFFFLPSCFSQIFRRTKTKKNTWLFNKRGPIVLLTAHKMRKMGRKCKWAADYASRSLWEQKVKLFTLKNIILVQSFTRICVLYFLSNCHTIADSKQQTGKQENKSWLMEPRQPAEPVHCFNVSSCCIFTSIPAEFSISFLSQRGAGSTSCDDVLFAAKSTGNIGKSPWKSGSDILRLLHISTLDASTVCIYVTW